MNKVVNPWTVQVVNYGFIGVDFGNEEMQPGLDFEKKSKMLMTTQEQIQSYAEKNCVNISVKPKSCHCCVDIEFNDTTATFNTNNGKEELQTLLYDLVAGNIK